MDSSRSRTIPSTSHRRSTAIAVACTVVLGLALCGGNALAIEAGSADDVCPVDSDPCSVTTTVDVIDGSILDFGTRTVSVSGGGRFRFGAGSGSIRCGSFEASTTGPAIGASGSLEEGGTAGGVVELDARRSCSAVNPARPCIDLEDCQLGSCRVRRCSERSTRTCTEDAHCQAGACGSNRRCAGALTIRCSTNSDCDFGTCPAQLTCVGSASEPVACAFDTECDFGTCSIGTGSIVLDGSIAGRADRPGDIRLRAADSVTISQPVSLRSTSSQSDGGELHVAAIAGDVVVSASVDAKGGKLGTGGDLSLTAGRDIVVAARLNISGGDFDGGQATLEADRDVRIEARVLANSMAGAGFGGSILATAGRDLSVGGGSAQRRVTLECKGHRGAGFFSGDGGAVDLQADRDLAIHSHATLFATGALHGGFGGDVFLFAGGDLAIDGDVSATGQSGSGAGGSFASASGGTTSVSEGAFLNLTGGDTAGGDVDIRSDGALSFAGIADVGATPGGPGGTAILSSGANVTISGALLVAGKKPDASGTLAIEGCRITLQSGANLRNTAAGGNNFLVAYESMSLLAGSAMTTADGTNTLVYRTATKPPVVSGLVSPAPAFVVDGTHAGCPVCGNSEIDEGETCDDGNAVSGDGCDSDCLIE